ncbi:hypothetical protein IJG14_02010 [bacterium]|nr:hypothetical protein [bacterium]
MTENIFKKAIILIKDNLMVIQPLFVGVLIIMLIITPLLANKLTNVSFVFTLILSVLCLNAFLSGWYNCVKYTVSLKNIVYNQVEEKNEKQIEILKSFLPGVGEYMFPITVVFIFYLFLAYVFIDLYRLFASKMFVINNFPSDFINVVNTASQSEIAKYIQNNFSSQQMHTLLLILACGFVMYFIFSIIVLWFAPAVLYTSKNPFIAVIESIKFTIKNLGQSFLIVLVMFLINLCMSFSNILITNQYLAFIPMLLSFIYIMYYVVTVFLYYETKTQNNSIDRCECNGEI